LNSKPERPAPILTEDRIAAANAAEQQNSQVASGTIQHYYCANNCEGSGGDAAGTCPVCGSAYEHNQAWHNQNTAPVTTTTSDGISTGVGAVPPTQSTPEPPQNAAYTIVCITAREIIKIYNLILQSTPKQSIYCRLFSGSITRNLHG